MKRAKPPTRRMKIAKSFRSGGCSQYVRGDHKCAGVYKRPSNGEVIKCECECHGGN